MTGRNQQSSGRSIAVFYEHPEWFKPLFAELDRRGVNYDPLLAHDHSFNPDERDCPYALIVNRMSPSACGVAVQGHYTDELASGQLRPGARTNAATGAVVRPPEPTIPPATEDRARDALQAMAARNLKIDVVLQQNLELAAYGRYTSQPRGAEAAIAAAKSAVQQHESRREAEAKEEAERPWLVVHFDFRGPGGRSFSVGRQRIDQALADELREWQETMEARAKERGWEAPSGFNPGNWPPFTIEDADA